LNDVRRQDFEQRTNGKTTELFIMGIKYFLQMAETDSTIKSMNRMLESIG
jgi:hypothetical protein